MDLSPNEIAEIQKEVEATARAQKLEAEVAARTEQLSRANRNLEIDAALERIRRVTGEMKDPSDLIEVVKQIRVEVGALYGGSAVEVGLMQEADEETFKFWFIEGNLKTTGDVTIEGVGVLLVKGNIEIEHHFTISDPDVDAVGLYTNGNVQVKNGGLDMNGHWYANGNITLEEETFFRGTLATSGNAEFKRDVTIEYRPVIASLYEAIFETTPSAMTPTLQDAREW